MMQSPSLYILTNQILEHSARAKHWPKLLHIFDHENSIRVELPWLLLQKLDSFSGYVLWNGGATEPHA